MKKNMNTSSAALTEDDRRKMRKAALIKMLAMGIFVVVVMVFGSIAWFTSNKENAASGMGVRVQAVPFLIETKSQSGYYKTQYDSLHSEAAEWMISAEHNLDNHINAKEGDEQEPALEPGDHGSLEFRVSPQSTNTLTVDCLFEIKAYVEEESEDEGGNTVTNITETDNIALAGYLNAHIMLFTGVDQNGKLTGLIDNNNDSLERILKNQTYTRGESTYTTIYWYWPEHLSDLTDSANTIYAPSEHEAVLAYVPRNKDGFFKDCSDSNAKVLTDLTNLYNSYSSYSNPTYNHYNLRYDNADLDIGNNLSYVILSMQVK